MTEKRNVNVLCLKWGKKYPSEYVNILHASVKRNLTLPHRFICITDDPRGLHPEIEVKDLIMCNKFNSGWWHKLSYFASPLYDIEGTVLTLDLDIVIVENIDCFFEMEGDFCIQRDIIPKNGFNSSIMRFEAGKHSDILGKWNPAWIGKYLPSGEWMWGDQAWITKNRPKATTWQEGWVRSYKWECCKHVYAKTGYNRNRNRNNKSFKFELPVGCKIIMFHGKPHPHEALHNIGKWWK